MTGPKINPHRARELRRQGMSWAQVAHQLTFETNRRAPLQALSAANLVKAAFGTSRVRTKRWRP